MSSNVPWKFFQHWDVVKAIEAVTCHSKMNAFTLLVFPRGLRPRIAYNKRKSTFPENNTDQQVLKQNNSWLSVHSLSFSFCFWNQLLPISNILAAQVREMCPAGWGWWFSPCTPKRVRKSGVLRPPPAVHCPALGSPVEDDTDLFEQVQTMRAMKTGRELEHLCYE